MYPYLVQMPYGGVGYNIFRDITKSPYNAKGDGTHDDTDAINRAISDGNRCGAGCNATSTKGAIIYFPPGKYLISKPIIQYYYTQFVGDPNSRATIIGSPTFDGIALIDSDVYIDGGNGAEWCRPFSSSNI
jgi:Pectate lyase superfamily protein